MNDKPKILVADDEEFLVRAYSDGLNAAGFEVMTASTGKEALERIRAEKPDMVLLDLILPEIKGLEVLRTLKSDKKLKDIPVLILSNFSREEDEKEAQKLGAKEYIVKANVSLKEVINKVKQHLN